MILVDTNLLVYSQVSTFPQHGFARQWLDSQLNGVTAVGLPWPSLLSFVRLVTNPRVFEEPLTFSRAWDKVEEWLNCEPAWIPSPGERHRALLGTLLTGYGMRANLVPDAHLAALAIEHGLTLCSCDADFARFPGLRWQNPLDAPNDGG